MRKSGIAAIATGLILLPFFAVQACGPDFRPDVFVRSLRPDQPKEFAAGKLGMLLPTYPREDLIVAFRYLNGGVLSAQEQAAYQPTYSLLEPEWGQQWNTSTDQAQQKPPAAWSALHEKYSGRSADVTPDRSFEVKGAGGYTYQSSYLNCNDDAFHNAALTLQSRAQSWGAHSTLLTDWLRGQDAVFANCSGTDPVLPTPVADDAPALLKADRTYQSAAALFYAGKFDDARSAFAAIHHDSSSPWQGIAGYLEARCLVRQAFLSNSTNTPGQTTNYDPAQMQQAAGLLQSLLKEKHSGISQAAIQRELNLVRIRIDPLAQVRELAIALAGPATDPAYTQNLKDLTWFLDQKLDSLPFRQDTDNQLFLTEEQKKISWNTKPGEAQRAAAFSNSYTQASDIRGAAPLVDWVLTLQSPATEAKVHAFAEWKKTQALYWLVVAITKANGSDATASDLITAASHIENNSPAWETVTYHRARLLLETGKAGEARTLLDQMLLQLRTTHQDSAVNLYQSLRMDAAGHLNDFLQYAPLKLLLRSSEAGASSDECLTVMSNDPKRKYDCVNKVDAGQFNDTAAGFFNAQAPLSVLIDTANSSVLPAQLKQAVAMMAWTRSILLNNDAAAKALLPALPTRLQQQAGTGTGFPAIMALVRNPGLRPYLEAGVQRSYSYDFVESYRDNWWCKGLESSWASGSAPFASEQAAFLTDAQRKEATPQVQALMEQDGAKSYLGNLVLAYAKEHPDDQDVPEALYLVLRMIRYGCDREPFSPYGSRSEEEKNVDGLKRDVSRLLRQRYIASPWTKKAAPFAG